MDRLQGVAETATPTLAGGKGEPALTVLDTNVVLDWLVFDEPSVQPLGAALTAGRLRWLTTPAMLAEQRHVFAAFAGARWRARPQALEAAFAKWAEIAEAPVVASPPRCSDASDQMFVDLAVAHRARWLISHDRALLKLARQLRGFGIGVMTPIAWSTSAGA